jgi:hypothetical protein
LRSNGGITRDINVEGECLGLAERYGIVAGISGPHGDQSQYALLETATRRLFLHNSQYLNDA